MQKRPQRRATGTCRRRESQEQVRPPLRWSSPDWQPCSLRISRGVEEEEKGAPPKMSPSSSLEPMVYVTLGGRRGQLRLLISNPETLDHPGEHSAVPRVLERTEDSESESEKAGDDDRSQRSCGAEAGVMMKEGA